jgi:hypothetical protein
VHAPFQFECTAIVNLVIVNLPIVNLVDQGKAKVKMSLPAAMATYCFPSIA